MLAVAATFTAEPVAETLDFWSRRLGWDLDVAFAAYNQVFQEMLSPGSTIRRNSAGANALLVRWDDLVSSPAAGPVELERAAAELAVAVREGATANGIPHIVLFARSGVAAVDQLERVEQRVAADLKDLGNVHVVTTAQTERRYPVRDWRDAAAEQAGRIPYTPSYFVALGTQLARALHGLWTPPAKVIVLDCDNTLWGGVCGEDGVAGVRVDGPFRALQEFMVRQSEAGRLLCLCSRNQEADVRAVFETRSDMPLRWEHIVAHRISWDAKPASLRSLATELGLALDSFIFVDDSHLECGAMMEALPEVLTVRLPDDADAIPTALEHVWAFDAPRVTAEDTKRAEMYRQERVRQDALAQAGSLARFIESMQLRIDIAPLAEAGIDRAAQLTERTNQFNSTTIRRSAADIRALLDCADRLCLRVSVSDRYGDYGMVGVATAQHTGDVLAVDALMLSCRALARGVEHRMIAALGESARAAGALWLDIAFVSSPRNEPVARFLRFLAGLHGAVRQPDGTVRLPADTACAVRFDADAPGTGDAGAQDAVADVAAEDAAGAHEAAAGAMPGARARTGGLHLEWTDPERILAALRQELRRRPDLQRGFARPRPGTEHRLAELWRDVLRLDRVGADDRFSDLGGTSVHLVRVHSRLQSELAVSADIVTLFRHTTVRELAGWIDGVEPADGLVRARACAQLQRQALTNARGRR